MVSFTQAFYRVSAVVATSLIDPNNTHQELSKTFKGSLDAKIDAEIDLNGVKAESQREFRRFSLFQKEKKGIIYSTFRPCKRLVSKVGRIKKNIKLTFKS